MEQQTDYLNLAFEAWCAWADLRKRRERFKRYTYGRQWSDPVAGADGRVMEEGEAAALSGRQPMTNNMIRQLVKCVIGNFRNTLPERDRSEVDRATAERNSLTELDCRMLEEFLISGCAIQRVVSERRIGGSGVWIDNVSPGDFFVNRFTDPRGLDIELAGMLHSMSLRETLIRFGSTPAMVEEIRRAYAQAEGSCRHEGTFFEAPDRRCRVIELWTLESRSILKCHDPERGRYFVAPASESAGLTAINRRRKAEQRQEIRAVARTTMRWHCRYLTPSGHVLQEFDSPYRHGGHPFAVKFYPLTDGEVHSFVEDIIDQQRNVNRLITMIDHVMGVSAKGVLLFPIDQKPETMSWAEIARRWASCDGIIPYQRGFSDGEPKQIISAGEQSGAYNLLALQMKLFEQISGVSGALQGQLPGGNPSAAMYDAQMRNSSVAILDLLDSFNAFRRQRDALVRRV